VCPTDLGFGIRTNIVQILGRVEELGIVPLLACEVKRFGTAL